MNNKQILAIHKYRDLDKEEIVKTILTIVKINDHVLYNSSILELSEYLKRLEEIFGEIKKCKII